MAFFDFFTKPDRNSDLNQEECRHTGNTNIFSEDPNRPSQKAIIYKSELDYISRCILDYPNIETGGQLFGFWTATGTPVVAYVIGPGKNAQHNHSSFIQDQNYLQSIGRELHRRYRLQHIGEWHSHHQLGLAHPSGGDVDTMEYGVGKPGFPRLLLCIGNCSRTHTTVNAFNFHENTPRKYVHAAWDVVDVESPYRSVADMGLQRILIHPSTERVSHGDLHTMHNAVREDESIQVHWLTENVENVDIMKSFVVLVKKMFPDYSVKTEILSTGEPIITVQDGLFRIKLPYGFPEKAPRWLTSDKNRKASYNKPCKKNENYWTFAEGSLTAAFESWLNASADTIPHTDSYKPTKQDKTNIHQAQTRIDRMGYENQKFSTYFHQSAFIWSEITDEPVVSIIAYPFKKEGRQGVVRMTMTSDFPEIQPTIQYGFYEEDGSTSPSLPGHIAHIHFRALSDLFHNACKVYCDMLQWNDKTSIFKAYIVACIMLNYYLKAARESRDALDYLAPLIDDKKQFENLITELARKIKAKKQ